MQQGIQTHLRDRDREISLYGCYALSILKLASIINGKEFTVDEVLDIIDKNRRNGVIGKQCYVQQSVVLLNSLTDRKFKHCLKVSVNEKPNLWLEEPIIVCLKKPMFTDSHFVYRDVNGTWDPLDPDRASAVGYEDDSFRRFV